MSVHQHRESLNPRHAGRCDCGAQMFRGRDPELERMFIEEACTSRTEPSMLIELMRSRADAYGPRLRVGPDWLAEALDEAPDFCNYLVWDLEEHFDAEDREELLLAIGEVATAFERVATVRARRRLG